MPKAKLSDLAAKADPRFIHETHLNTEQSCL